MGIPPGMDFRPRERERGCVMAQDSGRDGTAVEHIHIDLGATLWVLGVTAGCLTLLRLADGYARRMVKRRTRRAVDAALEGEDSAQ